MFHKILTVLLQVYHFNVQKNRNQTTKKNTKRNYLN